MSSLSRVSRHFLSCPQKKSHDTELGRELVMSQTVSPGRSAGLPNVSLKLPAWGHFKPNESQVHKLGACSLALFWGSHYKLVQL